MISSLIDKAYFGCHAGSYGGGIGIAGGRAGEWGIEEGGADRIIRSASRDGLAVSVAFRSTTCPFLYTVKVRLSPTDLC